MKLRHDDLSRRQPLLFNHSGRNASTIIRYGNRLIRMNRHRHLTTVTRERLIN